MLNCEFAIKVSTCWYFHPHQVHVRLQVPHQSVLVRHRIFRHFSLLIFVLGLILESDKIDFVIFLQEYAALN
jgi:hypothetical protein